MTESKRLWAVVLAAGQGTRLSSLTRALYGHDLPKQFAVLAGERSMLQTTLDRLAPLAPPSRTVVVVARDQVAFARAQLAAYPGVELIVQPRSLDTGPGVLLPLAHVLGRDPGARVIVAPADHHVPNPRPMLSALASATADPAVRDRLALVGVVPDDAEPDYGWVVRGGRLSSRGRAGRAGGAWRVAEFREKPDRDVAAALRARGALWNTFLFTAPGWVLWELAHRHLPAQATALERYRRAVELRGVRDVPDTTSVLLQAYSEMAPANFSRDVLERADDLAVMPVVDTGWCDWGAPQRVFASLRGSADYTALLDRLGHHAAALAS